MSETTGSATDFEDLMTKFLTWAALQGWTINLSVSTVASGRQSALSKSTCFTQFRWGTTMGTVVSMHQSTGFTAGIQSGLHPGDSGNGFNTSTSTIDSNLDDERCLDQIGNGPFPSYYFYTNATGDYLHVVAERATDSFIHFGMAVGINKFGNWNTMSGGAYAYGQSYFAATNSISTASQFLLDGGATTDGGSLDSKIRGATIRLAGAPAQSGAGVWGEICGIRATAALTDHAGNARARVLGGYRGGMLPRAFGNFPAGNSSGLAPLTPIALWYNDIAASPDRIYLLGFMADVRMLDLTYFAPKDTFTLGADTWRVFPIGRRAEGAAAGNTDFLGVAYKV